MPFFDKEAFEIRNEIIVPWGSPKITQTKLSDEVTVGEPKVHLCEAGAEVGVQVEAGVEVEVEAQVEAHMTHTHKQHTPTRVLTLRLRAHPTHQPH